MRSWINGSADLQSTLSRPRSTEVITANGHNGTIPNGRTHIGVNGMNGMNGGLNGLNGINGMNGGPNGVLTRGPGGLHEDLEFPPTTRTLSKKKQIVWMRPHVRSILLYDFNVR